MSKGDELCTCGHLYRGHKWKGSARSGWRDHCETPGCLCKRGIKAKPGQKVQKPKGPEYATPEKIEAESSRLFTLADAGVRKVIKVKTGIKTLDNALDGGLVLDSTVLIAGYRGSGKSSLLTEACKGLVKKGPVLYVSGEESIEQFAYRAGRFGLPKNLTNLYIMAKANLDLIWEYAEKVKPMFIIVDSLQSVHGRDMNGAFVANTRATNAFSYQLKLLRQKFQACLILVGHESKNGEIAGSQAVQHDVDVVGQLTPDDVSNARVLEFDKNRFGKTPGIFRFVLHEDKVEEIVPLDVARIYKTPELL